MFSVLIKQSDESRNTTTTLTDDGELTIPLDAGTTYFVDCAFTFEGNATADIKYAWVYTGTITRSLLTEGSLLSQITGAGGSGDGKGPSYNYTNVSAASRALAGNNTANTKGGGNIRGVIVTNSSGNLKLQWSQNTSDAGNVTVHGGSYLSKCKQADMDGTLIVKTSDTSRTNNTLTADPDLVFDTKANKKYIGEMMVLYNSSSNTPDYKFEFKDAGVTISAGDTWNCILNTNNAFDPATSSGTHGQWREAAFVSAPSVVATSLSSASTSRSFNQPMWSHQMGGSDGQFVYSWAQNTTNAVASVLRAPSWLWFQEVEQA